MSAATEHRPGGLSASVIAALAPSAFLLAHLSSLEQEGRRPNGRLIGDFRKPTCTVGSLTHCYGSAVIRTGDTAVVCGVQAEILLKSAAPDISPNQDDASTISQLNLLVPNLDLATGCTPYHLPGGPPSVDAQTLSQRLLRLLLSTRLVNLNDLKIRCEVPSLDDSGDNSSDVSAYWVLYPSIHVLSLDGESSLFDVAWAALVAAIRDVRLPAAWWDADLEAVLCSDRMSDSRRLSLPDLPFSCTWGTFTASTAQLELLSNANGTAESTHPESNETKTPKTWLLADPDGFESQLCRETITVVLDGKRLLRIEKSGGLDATENDFESIMDFAGNRWKQWMAALPNSSTH